MRELASDLVKKAKEIDALIEVLPGVQQTEEEQVMMTRFHDIWNTIIHARRIDQSLEIAGRGKPNCKRRVRSRSQRDG